ncbi:hypothetical protein HanXRQr2_Chr07g0312531 [Helianthus annuus]|uniref:Uncharacterized protein n=1 Tax=Helianthus annuus TaxID=4232 RepID=A0A251UD94_HELAN|nr:hypothetical protein HanXRQr2_Chr07g0312531 [Helianthus annuus]KAJ0906165.1 hypothetical protein HanPSC8_Chr07g0302381 [Helianthus annuus]
MSACSSLDKYCTKLKEIDEQLKDVDQPVPESRLVLQLARDLPPEYSVTAALIHQQSPTWDIARDMIEREAQRLAALETAQVLLTSNKPTSPPPSSPIRNLLSNLLLATRTR